ncbi:MAG TPA: methyltransferase domain-containing protein [Thermomicrobiales bacterium]|nr:methyltransferase domain-containing protein [Thermomicrobiales bacterium]
MSEMTDPALQQATDLTRHRYDRIAGGFDRMEALAERRMAGWRAELWQRVRGPRVLELGVGTGKNMSYYPAGAGVTAIDISPRMLDIARARAAVIGVDVELREADAQRLPFADASFDTVVATFVFCSVPDAVVGLREARRVLAPEGQLLLLEHVLSENRLLKPLMRAANPVVVRVMGANINRRTVVNVERAGFTIERVDDLWRDIVKLIEARPDQEDR